MVAFKGRSAMKQYMPLQPIKRGFKIWVMCCTVTGYMVAFDVYVGKDDKRPADMNLGEYVVYKLSEALEGFYYCLFFDNFFTLVLLLKRLVARKLFACGTIRQNRKLFPETMKKSKLNPGKCTSFRREILAFHNGNILARPTSASLVQCIIQLRPQKSREHLKLVKKKK
jgi:hypothetical protein